MLIREIMSTNIDCISPFSSIMTAARRMRDEQVGALPVGRDGHLVGMVTDRDIVIRLLPLRSDLTDACVFEAMSAAIQVCYEDETIYEAAVRMAKFRIRRLPVLSRSGGLIGLISLGDIAREASETIAGNVLGEIVD